MARVYRGFEIFKAKNGYFITFLRTVGRRCDAFGPFKRVRDAKEKIDQLVKLPYYEEQAK